jgi:hypothetical protein
MMDMRVSPQMVELGRENVLPFTSDVIILLLEMESSHKVLNLYVAQPGMVGMSSQPLCVQDANVEAAREICASLQALVLESKGTQAIDHTQVNFVLKLT